MSINQLFEISRRSFRAVDAAMNTAGQNVANAETPGYTRRRIITQADSYTGSGLHNALPSNVANGHGVSVQRYERMRDMLLSTSLWESQAGLGTAEEEHRILSAVEGLLPAGGDGSLTDTLAEFWNAWSDVANSPVDDGVRFTLRNQAVSLTGTLNRLDLNVTRMAEETRQAAASGVEDINELIGKIADLNEKIRGSEAAGRADLAAADKRDQLVHELSAFVPLRVEEDEAGNYNLSVDGVQVLEASSTTLLAFDPDTDIVSFEGTGLTFEPTSDQSGRLGAWMSMLNETLPGFTGQLDTFAATMVEEINALHRAGYAPDDTTGHDFFDPDHTTAGSIRVADAVLADVGTIAAAGTPGNAGDSETALAIADLRSTKLFGGGAETPEGYVINLFTDLGARVERASARSVSQTAISDHLESLERGVSGVSLDEELSSLIRYQQAYGASARVLTAAQQMLDTLLSL